MAEGPRDSEVVVLKERFLIPTEPLREGMLRFSFLLETCAPGSVPDPQLIAAVLDLVSRVYNSYNVKKNICINIY